MLAAVGYTAVFNLTGNPVVTLPLAQSAQGLPTGIQVVGSRWQDTRPLNVAEAVGDMTDGYLKPAGLR